MALVDLFCGSGGFSLGAHRAGFEVSAAFDIDSILTSSFQKNFPGTRLALADVSTLTGEQVKAIAGNDIEGIFGGPPCQGFSEIGRKDVNDPRRKLLGHFFRLVAELQPRFFVMENVRGLAHSDAREVLEAALNFVTNDYQILGPLILDAADFGAATRRQRLFVIGVRNDLKTAITLADIEAWMRPAATVEAALSDLSGAIYVGDTDGLDTWRIAKKGPPHAYARTLRSLTGQFTSHRIVQHKAEISARFAKVPPGGTDAIGRHPRLSWHGQCPTLRAGTGSDRGSYQAVRPLHPEEPRVITVREAARLQGFPDDHEFHPTTWHSFRMIGNSVSPVIAEAIFGVIAAKLGRLGRKLVA
ncbi:DNA cytosine methyltransferase [Robbsia sp. KACC 23696]|uniref:DNA cytosine methyltransferase n=1 Tax=Robbsia sp. KACC 23696 TaxID=3149231 RepID=UPI00325BDC36